MSPLRCARHACIVQYLSRAGTFLFSSVLYRYRYLSVCPDEGAFALRSTSCLYSFCSGTRVQIEPLELAQLLHTIPQTSASSAVIRGRLYAISVLDSLHQLWRGRDECQGTVRPGRGGRWYSEPLFSICYCKLRTGAPFKSDLQKARVTRSLVTLNVSQFRDTKVHLIEIPPRFKGT